MPRNNPNVILLPVPHCSSWACSRSARLAWRVLLPMPEVERFASERPIAECDSRRYCTNVGHRSPYTRFGCGFGCTYVNMSSGRSACSSLCFTKRGPCLWCFDGNANCRLRERVVVAQQSAGRRACSRCLCAQWSTQSCRQESFRSSPNVLPCGRRYRGAGHRTGLRP